MAAWVARNTGLTGVNKNVNYIVQNPATRHLNSTSHELWIATGAGSDGGIFRSINGGRLWEHISLPQPNNDNFSPPGVPSLLTDLIFIWIDYDPTSELTLFALGADSSRERFFMYKTIDVGLTWSSIGLITA